MTPIADAVRAILDGHIVLSRKIAQRNHFPAIDILQSTSRVMNSVIDPTQFQWAAQMKEWIATYNQAEDLINIGAYVRGSNPRIDQSMFIIDKINEFLRQRFDEHATMESTLAAMHSIVRNAESFSAPRK